ncbi:MAG: hypothetical protein H6704_15520 [Myxococcales bacterium]|nr:hypothetical protein [Myxococcales bacterium]
MNATRWTTICALSTLNLLTACAEGTHDEGAVRTLEPPTAEQALQPCDAADPCAPGFFCDDRIAAPASTTFDLTVDDGIGCGPSCAAETVPAALAPPDRGLLPDCAACNALCAHAGGDIDRCLVGCEQVCAPGGAVLDAGRAASERPRWRTPPVAEAAPSPAGVCRPMPNLHRIAELDLDGAWRLRVRYDVVCRDADGAASEASHDFTVSAEMTRDAGALVVDLSDGTPLSAQMKGEALTLAGAVPTLDDLGRRAARGHAAPTLELTLDHVVDADTLRGAIRGDFTGSDGQRTCTLHGGAIEMRR